MPIEFAELVLREEPDATSPTYSVNIQDFNLFVFPGERQLATKMQANMSVSRSKVPPNGSAPPTGSILSQFTGEMRDGEFYFSISNVQVRLINIDASNSTANMLIEFELPGALVPSSDKLLKDFR